MQPHTEATVLSDRKKISNTFLFILFCIVFSVLSATAFYAFLRYTTNKSTVEEITLMNQIVSDAQNMDFEFTAVPNARERIILPAPTAVYDTDALIYDQLKLQSAVAEDVVQNDVAFNMPFKGMTFIEYVNTIENPAEIYQIIDELHELTLILNQQFNRAPLADRIGGVQQMAPLDPISPGSASVGIYPSIRAVDAYVVAEIMTQLDPENEQLYKNEAEALIKRGIGYGLYGQSDADAAQTLVQQYLDLYNSSPL